tara:strand:- start:23030 stop:23323 length:294 start_codon:yes stop_codon:yes gene_type:complete
MAFCGASIVDDLHIPAFVGALSASQAGRSLQVLSSRDVRAFRMMGAAISDAVAGRAGSNDISGQEILLRKCPVQGEQSLVSTALCRQKRLRDAGQCT